jgi:hypothetical protein
MLKLNAYMASCSARDEVRQRTIANLSATDWKGTLTVEFDDPSRRYPLERHNELLRRILRRAAKEEEIFLFLEDDLDFNRYLLHNLSEWAPLQRLLPGGHFFASLCNIGVPVRTSFPELAYSEALPSAAVGSHAFVIAQPTARYLLTCWGVESGPRADVKVLRLAARVGPLLHHLPSLVQHIGIHSLCGGLFQDAADFDKEWRSIQQVLE